MSASVIEAMLLRWGESHASGRTVTFVLPEDPGPHPFKGMKCGPDNGQRVALSVALIADDETVTPVNGKRAMTDLKRSNQAFLMCDQTLFQKFLAEETESQIDNTIDASIAVREYCGVNSRSQLDNAGPWIARWDGLYECYQVWKHPQ